jgi:hypothetical protein
VEWIVRGAQRRRSKRASIGPGGLEADRSISASGSLAGTSKCSIESSADNEEDEFEIPWSRASTSAQSIGGSAFRMKLMQRNTHSSELC